MNKIISCRRISFDVQISRNVSEKVKTCLKNRKRNPDEGGLLVEVLVGMLILVIVFTATTIALSSMADRRIQVEQRDRALALASSYDELSKTYKCGFLVDRIQDSLAKAPTGLQEYENRVSACDFEALAANNSNGTNAGDQSFTKEENINENNSTQRFIVDIRYWWEWPGENWHTLTCANIDIPAHEELPLIMVRAIKVSWREKGVPREVGIIKRDPVPNSDVVFASGNRVSILVPQPAPGVTTWNTNLRPYEHESSSYSINRIIDDAFPGQPKNCVVFSYITPDILPARAVGTGLSNVPPDTPAQSFRGVS